MKITFERSGGFAGVSLRTEVDTAQLPPAQARELERLVGKSRLLGPSSREKAEDNAADSFQYSVTVERDGEKTSAPLDAASLSAHAPKLIDWLLDRVRSGH